MLPSPAPRLIMRHYLWASILSWTVMALPDAALARASGNNHPCTFNTCKRIETRLCEIHST